MRTGDLPYHGRCAFAALVFWTLAPQQADATTPPADEQPTDASSTSTDDEPTAATPAELSAADVSQGDTPPAELPASEPPAFGPSSDNTAADPSPAPAYDGAPNVGQSDAQPQPDSAAKTEYRPEIALAGSQDEDATASIGFSWWRPTATPGSPKVWTGTASFEVKTARGIGDILAVTNKPELNVQIPATWGGSVSFGAIWARQPDEVIAQYLKQLETNDSTTETKLNKKKKNRAEAQRSVSKLPYDELIERHDESVRLAAATMCVQVCDPGDKSDACKAFNKWRTVRANDAGIEWAKQTLLVEKQTSVDALLSAVRSEFPASTVNDACAQASLTIELRTLAQSLVSAVGGSDPYRRQLEAFVNNEGGLVSVAKACKKVCSDKSDASCDEVRSNYAFLVPDPRLPKTGDAPGVNNLCAVGRTHYDDVTKQEQRRKAGYRFNRGSLVGGASLGLFSAEYLRESGMFDVSATDSRVAYRRYEKPYGILRFGVSGSYLWFDQKHGGGLTYEARLIGSYGYEASKTTGSTCALPAAEVETNSMGDTVLVNNINSCSNVTLGAPTETFSLLIEPLYLGFADLRTGFIRLSIGPRYKLAISNISTCADDGPSCEYEHDLSVRMPISINFLELPRRNDKLDFNGIFRLTPFVGVKPGDTISDTNPNVPVEGGVIFEVLLTRGLFSSKWDEL